jgi:hypothetical protein
MAQQPDDQRKNEGTAPDPNAEPVETKGFWQSTPSDDPAGYGGGRERAEQFNDESFGETGWGGQRGTSGQPAGQEQRSAHSAELPEGARVVPDGPNWDEKFAHENAAKYGQAGGQPVEQRGESQSRGGFDHKEQSTGDNKDVSARGGYGIRETERWGHDNPGQDGSANKTGKE